MCLTLRVFTVCEVLRWGQKHPVQPGSVWTRVINSDQVVKCCAGARIWAELCTVHLFGQNCGQRTHNKHQIRRKWQVPGTVTATRDSITISVL